MSGEKLLHEALLKVREYAKWNGSYTIYDVANAALTKYTEDTVMHYITKENSEPSQIPNCS